MIKELLKRDFGLELDIAGGTGQSKNDPIYVLSPSEKEASRTEVLVLRGLGKGRGILWRTVNIEIMSGMEVIQRKIETKEIHESEIVSQIENYYFLRKNTELHSTNINSQNIVFIDDKVGIFYPYEISWLHYDGITDYSSQGREDLGYSLSYNAPGIKATIYVYPKVSGDTVRDILELELATVIAEIKSIYGNDEIDHDWEARSNYDHILYYYIPKHALMETSLILIMRIGNCFVKLRCSFVDEAFMREISSDFLKCFLLLMRNNKMQ